MLTPNEFIWSNFYRTLSHNTQVNYADKCKLRYEHGMLIITCANEDVKRFAEDRWKSTLDRMFITDVMFMTDGEELPF